MSAAILNLDVVEQVFNSLFEDAPFAAALFSGEDLKIDMANPLSLRLWGKDSSIIGKPLLEGIPELKGQPLYDILLDVYRTGRTYEGKEEIAYVQTQDALKPVYVNRVYKPIRDTRGQVIGVFGVGYEVTEHVNNKVKVIESEQAVRNLFEQTPVGLVMFKGESFVVEMVNDTLLNYWGRKREEVINKPVFDVLPEVALQAIEEISQEVFRTGIPYSSPETPVTLLRNGKMETIVVRFGLQALKDGQGAITGVLAIANDITDMVTARQKVEKNEMRLKFLADSMPQVVWIADGDGRVTYYNKRVLAFAGIKQHEDGTWAWQNIIHPDDVQLTTLSWQRALKNRTPYQIEHRMMMKDGSFRWHLSRAYAYETDEGIKWYGTATDVHDQKVLERNLEGLVRERTLELQRSNDDLQQFAHVASHDLKEPVRKIKTFSYKLQDEYEGVLGERGNTFVNKIIQASDRMNAMISGVLNYASMPASAHAIEPVSLNGVIQSIKSDLEVLIAEKKATIASSGLPVIGGIRDLIHQLFYNLINNSLKFSHAGVAPVIDISSSEVTVARKHYYKVVVRDNGIGFDQAYAEQIFTSFFRLNAKDRYEGSGLGLALCKKIAERHGGMISAKAEKDKGAQFEILLPKQT